MSLLNSTINNYTNIFAEGIREEKERREREEKEREKERAQKVRQYSCKHTGITEKTHINAILFLESTNHYIHIQPIPKPTGIPQPSGTDSELLFHL